MTPEATPPHGPMGLIETPWWELWQDLLVFGIAGLLLLALWGVYLWRRRRASSQQAPRDSGLARWDRLAQDVQGLVPNQDKLPPEELSRRLSAALRCALEWRWGIPASRQTTQELRQSLQTLGELSAEEGQRFLDFFHWAEAIQFSGHKAFSEDTWHAWHLAVQGWLRDLRPNMMEPSKQ